jgi:hypothetical protein
MEYDSEDHANNDIADPTTDTTLRRYSTGC